MSSSSSLPIFRVVGFSGHRQVADAAGVARVIRAELEALRRDAREEWIALSSVALGGDQIFVEQARALGLAWHAILPLPAAEFAKDFAAADWAEVEKALARAEHVHVITENGTREDAYLDCGIETVNGADVLIALWDGEPARGKGGTADVVAYARSHGKPTLIIDPHTLAVRRVDFENFRRDDASLVELNALPASTGGWGHNPFNAPANIFAFQQKCDHAATRGAPYFRRLIVATVVFHVAATLIAAAALSYDLHLAMLPWLKLGFLVGALGVAIVLGKHHHSLKSWVHCRLAAELCRSALATWGLPRSATLYDDLDLPHTRAITRSLQILHRRGAAVQTVPMEEFRRRYLAQRIDDQLGYYRRQEARALPLFARLKLGFWIATILALGCTLAYALCHTSGVVVPGWVESGVFYFLPISLPVVAASFISLISINDLQRRVARYREMQLMLDDARKRLLFSQTWNSLERVVLKTERALRQEMLEWHSITSFAESH